MVSLKLRTMALWVRGAISKGDGLTRDQAASLAQRIEASADDAAALELAEISKGAREARVPNPADFMGSPLVIDMDKVRRLEGQP